MVKKRQIGIRELRSKLSECVREVKKGAIIVVTERGRPVARIILEPNSLAKRLEALRRAGAIHWSGRRLKVTKPVARVRGRRTVSDIVIENRE